MDEYLIEIFCVLAFLVTIGVIDFVTEKIKPGMRRWPVNLAFIGLAIATNPSASDHREAIALHFQSKLSYTDDKASAAARGLASAMFEKLLTTMVKRENFIVISFSRIEMEDQSKCISVGVFGNVWITDFRKSR